MKEHVKDIKNFINNKNCVFCSTANDKQNIKFKKEILNVLDSKNRTISIDFPLCFDFSRFDNYINLETNNDKKISKDLLIRSAYRLGPDALLFDLSGKEIVEVCKDKSQTNNILFCYANNTADLQNRMETMYLMGENKSLDEIRKCINIKFDYLFHFDKDSLIIDECIDLKGDVPVYENVIHIHNEEIDELEM